MNRRSVPRGVIAPLVLERALLLLPVAASTRSGLREKIVLGHDDSEQAKNQEDRRGALNRTRHAKHTEAASETQR